MKSFKGKTVVITGGATGIGFGFAKAFGADGANIVLGEPREARLREAVDGLGELGIEARYTLCDVTKPDSVAALADFAWSAYGHVDVLINNAGISIPMGPVAELPLEKLHNVFNVNFFGVWHGSAIFGKRMIEQGTPAAIYNLGSENSFFLAVPESAAYAASKHAVLALTDSLREELPDFIHVGLICPGFVRSELVPESARPFAMATDRFVEIAMEQIRAGEFYIVSHAYNMEHIRARYDEISAAYAKYAPRYEGDQEFDVRTLLAGLGAADEDGPVDG